MQFPVYRQAQSASCALGILWGNHSSTSIKTGHGDDFIAFWGNYSPRDVKVQMGHGSDELWFAGSVTEGNLNVHGGADSDAVQQEESTVDGNTSSKSVESASIDNALRKAFGTLDRLADIWD